MHLTPEILLAAYCQGAFPMGRSHDDPDLLWLSPHLRGVLPLDGLHIGRSLKRTLHKAPYQITADTNFSSIMAACATPATGRDDTWITPQIIDLYTQLHEMGFAHSIECWDGDTLAGGLYGLAIGGAFFGESMVSHRASASKVALVHLVARLRAGGYTLLDTQFTTPHLTTLGAIEIPREIYLHRLETAIRQGADFFPSETKISREIMDLCATPRS
ncbi:MAG: leucyl/phenylalanyl-tRNA--protein transferase [Rhodospirillaceae bacterium]|nr:leucyl/phenylalanyl-tRNA--protein transferase [Rhodospirillaceae bacterium]